MLKSFKFHPEAREELDSAVEYYDGVRPGLGLDFLEEIYATIQRILDFPEAWTQLSPNTRSCLANRFPYGVIYQVQPDHVDVIAVARASRKPGYWKKRI